MTYADAGIIIRLLEGDSQTVGRMAMAVANDDLCTSIISVAECLTKPLRENNKERIRIFNSFFDEVRLDDVTRAVCAEAAVLRSRNKMKTPDAIHLATAKLAAVSRFLTCDKAFGRRQSECNFDIVVLPP